MKGGVAIPGASSKIVVFTHFSAHLQLISAITAIACLNLRSRVIFAARRVIWLKTILLDSEKSLVGGSRLKPRSSLIHVSTSISSTSSATWMAVAIFGFPIPHIGSPLYLPSYSEGGINFPYSAEALIALE